MKSDVDVFRSRVILVILSKRDSRLVIRKQSGGMWSDVEELGKEGSKPEGFLSHVSSRYVLTLSRR